MRQQRIADGWAPCRQCGVGLIEVMVSVLVLAIGLLGIAALQSLTLKNAGASASRTQAIVQAYSMMDIVRSDRSNISSYNTNIFVENSGNAMINAWLAGLKTMVAPDAKGKVVCRADTMTCSVAVQWSEARATGGSQSEPYEISVTSQI